MWKVPKVDKNYEGIMKVNKSFLVLHGHRSIVNQVCFNKHTSMLCTAGVEKMVKVRKNVLKFHFCTMINTLEIQERWEWVCGGGREVKVVDMR